MQLPQNHWQRLHQESGGCTRVLSVPRSLLSMLENTSREQRAIHLHEIVRTLEWPGFSEAAFHTDFW